MGTILRAAADGDLTPDEAVSIASLIETRRRTIETLELEQRIAALEQNRETPVAGVGLNGRASLNWGPAL